jgi:drug/metabolite transporter (DMT)-like permease
MGLPLAQFVHIVVSLQGIVKPFEGGEINRHDHSSNSDANQMDTLAEFTPPISPYAGLAVGMVMVSTAAIAIRFAQREAPSLSIAAWRLTLASLILAPVVLSRHRDELARLTRSELMRATAAGLLLAVHFAAWISSLEFTSVAASVVLVATNPLFVGLLSPLLLGEPVPRLMFAGMLIAVVGSGVIGLDGLGGGNAPLVGDLLALAGAVCAAGYMMIGRTLRRKLTLLPYIFVVYGVAAITLLAVALASRQPMGGFTPETYGWLLYLALGPQLIGHTSFNWALRYLSAAYVTVTLLSEPIGSSLLAWLLLKEPPTRLEVLGGALILAGIAVASRVERVQIEPIDKSANAQTKEVGL